MAEVLIVCGDSNESAMLGEALCRAGHAIRLILPAEFRDSWDRRQADLLLRDLDQPADDSIQWIREVRANDQTRSTPIAVYSRQFDPARILLALEAGADSFLFLEQPPDEMNAAVRRVLARGGHADSSGSSRALISFRGQSVALGADREELLDLLVPTFEMIDRLNIQLAAEINRRAKAEQDMDRVQERFDLAVRGAGDGIWDWDVVTNKVFYSPRWKEMLGYRDDEINNNFAEWERLLHPDDRARCLETIKSYFEGRSPVYELEHRLRHKDGSYRWILARGMALRDASGKPYRMAGSHTDISERKRSEEQLRESEARFRDLFENASDLIQSVGSDGSYRYVNPAWRAAMGYSEEEVSRLRLRDVLHPDCVDRCMNLFRRLMQGEQIGRVEAKFVTKDGRTIEVEGTTSVYCKDGEPLATRGLLRDVTERNRVVAELRTQQDFINAVLDCTDAGIIVCDPHGRIVLFNRMLREIHGLPSDTIPPEQWAQYFDLYKADGCTPLRLRDVPLYRAMRGEHVVAEEIVVAPRNLPRRTVVVSASPIHDVKGSQLGAVLSFHDISARKRAEEELRNREAQVREFNRQLMDLAIHESILGSDISVAMRHFTETAARSLNVARCSVWLLNLDETDLLCYDLFEKAESRHSSGAEMDARTCPGYFRALENEQIIAADDACSDPRTCEFADSYLAPLGITSMLDSPLRLNGKVVGALCNEHIGAPRKWSPEEQNFAVSVASLISLTLEANERKQAEEEARAARDAAESANRAKSSFLANMSHEIRTPMNAIIGMTELALETKLNPEQRDYLELVKKSADSLLDIINEILDFSKIEAGRVDLESVEFGIRELVDEVLSTLATKAWQKGLELSGRVAPDVADRVIGDPVVRQILMNLIGNAIKFTETGEVYVEVCHDEKQDDDGVEHLHFLVRDTGIGVPKEKQTLIFDAFTQADSTTTRKYGGTGLGLTISSRLVSLMGGNIWVESEPGQGSRFQFTASFSRPAAQSSQPKPATWDAVTGVPVLIVDDHESNRRILDESLRLLGMKPTQADSGETALASLEKAKANGEPFPFVILDADMPIRDGFEVAAEMRRRGGLANSTILMLSGNRQTDLARCRQLGIAAYIAKPVRQNELRRALESAIGASRRENKHSPGPSDGTGEVRPLKILLAEDNPLNQKLAMRLLEKKGHRITVVNDGKEALARWEREPFDLVLMDVQMPVMDGLAVTRAIRERESHRGAHTAILAMTAYAMKGDRERCLQAGADDYVSKPIHSEELYAAIARLANVNMQLPASSANGDTMENLKKVVAWDDALSYVGGDIDLLRDLTGTFLNQCPQWLTKLDDALSDNNPVGVRDAAHPFKNSLNLLGAKNAANLACRLEKMGHDENLVGADVVRSELESELQRLFPALVDFAAAKTGRRTFVRG